MVLEPAAAVADFAARFGQDRLTPGNLGLELTTLLALLAVGTFAFFLLGDIVLLPGEPRIDRWAFDVADRLACDMLVDVAKVVTQLGSSPVTPPLVLGHRAVGRRAGAPIEAVALVAGWLLVVRRRAPRQGALRPPAAAGRAGRDTNAASRPATRPTRSRSWPAPSCSSAAASAGLRASPPSPSRWSSSRPSRVTRVYLRAHYLTDVLGGIALGVAIWSLVGVLALVAARVRHNGEPP